MKLFYSVFLLPLTFILFASINPAEASIRYNELYSVGRIMIFTDKFEYSEVVSSGSGTVIDDDGHILTNYHVVQDVLINSDREAIFCFTYDETKTPLCNFVLESVAYDEDLDVAVMKIKYFIEEDKNKITFEQFKSEYGTFLPSAHVPELYEGYGLSIGESITILGYPGTGGDSINYTKGTVSGFETLFHDGEYYEWRVKTDADIDHGSSGGAAFDDFNNFVGIPTEIAVDSDSVGYLISLPIINYFLLANDITLSGSSGMCIDLENGYFDTEVDDCFCTEGYAWDDDAYACMPLTDDNSDTIKDPITKDEIQIPEIKIDTDQTNDAYVQSEIDKLQPDDARLVDRLAGHILLQVEDHGEAWYLDPTTKNRYYMKDGLTAYEMLRAFGLGITNADLEKIKNGDTNLVNRLKGRIVLQVAAHGEAYYINPADGMVIYLKDGTEAYRLMRYHSLGIKNSDLAHIPIKKFVPID